MRVLLVEDRDEIREAFNELLLKDGHDVLQAENAEIALDLYRVSKDWVDVVVTDFEMGGPKLNGDYLISEIRDMGFEKPIKLITGLPSVPGDCLIGDTKYFGKGDFESVLESLK